MAARTKKLINKMGSAEVWSSMFNLVTRQISHKY